MDTIQKVNLTRATRGDRNGDGAADGAVIPTSNPRASGTFINLAAISNRHGKPRQAAAALLDDRVQVDSVTIVGDRVVRKTKGFAPSDPLCILCCAA